MDGVVVWSIVLNDCLPSTRRAITTTWRKKERRGRQTRAEDDEARRVGNCLFVCLFVCFFKAAGKCPGGSLPDMGGEDAVVWLVW